MSAQLERLEQIDSFEVRIIYKKNRHIYLRICPENKQVIVTCPYRTTLVQVRQVVRKNKSWILSRLDEVVRGNSVIPSVPTYLPGQDAVVWGRFLPVVSVRVSESSTISSTVKRELIRGRICRSEDNSVLLFPSLPELLRDSSGAWDRFYRLEMSERVAVFRPQIERLYGLWFDRVTLRWNKTRWGSCNAKLRKLNLNLALGMYDPLALRYVIFHEATHLFHPNHSSDFWSMLKEKEPRFAQYRAVLNQPPWGF